MSKYIKNDVQAIANLDEFTLSTGIYDYLHNEWLIKFEAACGDLKLSQNESSKAAFYAGMRAAQQLLALDGAVCASPECGGDMQASLTCVVCGVTRPASKA